MKKTAIFYGPVGGSTEFVAKKIYELIGSDLCDLVPVRDAGAADLQKYDNLIFGISTIGNETWQSEPVKSGWFSFINVLRDADIDGKTVALFGLGDQVRYADHFVDAMGELYNIISGKRVEIVGSVDPAGYEFRDSDAIVDGMFVGLPIDQDFESDLTQQRIAEWIKTIMPAFK